MTTGIIADQCTDRDAHGVRLKERFRFEFTLKALLLGQQEANASTLEHWQCYGDHRLYHFVVVVLVTLLYFVLVVTTVTATTHAANIAGAAMCAALLVALLVEQRFFAESATLQTRLWRREAEVTLFLIASYVCGAVGAQSVMASCFERTGQALCTASPEVFIVWILISVTAFRIAMPRVHIAVLILSVPVTVVSSIGNFDMAGLNQHRLIVAVIAVCGIICALVSWLISRSYLSVIAHMDKVQQSYDALKKRVDRVLPRIVDLRVVESLRLKGQWFSVYTGDAALVYADCSMGVGNSSCDPAASRDFWLRKESLTSRFVDALFEVNVTSTTAKRGKIGSANQKSSTTWLDNSILFRTWGDAVVAIRRAKPPTESTTNMPPQASSSTTEGASSIGVHEARQFFKTVVRFHSELSSDPDACNIRIFLHRGHVCCGFIGLHTVQLEFFGSAVVEAQACMDSCGYGELSVSSAVAKMLKDLNPVEQRHASTSSLAFESRGSVVVGMNPIPVDVLCVKNTNLAKRSGTMQQSMTTANGLDSTVANPAYDNSHGAIPSPNVSLGPAEAVSTTVAKRSVTRSKEVRVVSVTEGTEEIATTCAHNGLDELIQLAMLHPGSTTGGSSRSAGGHTTAAAAAAAAASFVGGHSGGLVTSKKGRSRDERTAAISDKDLHLYNVQICSALLQRDYADFHGLVRRGVEVDYTDEVKALIPSDMLRSAQQQCVADMTPLQRVLSPLVAPLGSFALAVKCAVQVYNGAYPIATIALSAFAALADLTILALATTSQKYSFYKQNIRVVGGIAMISSMLVVTKTDTTTSAALVALFRASVVVANSPQFFSIDQPHVWYGLALLYLLAVDVVVGIFGSMDDRVTALVLFSVMFVVTVCTPTLVHDSDSKAHVLRRCLSDITTTEMVAAMRMEKIALETFLGPTLSDLTLRSGLRLHAPKAFPLTIALAIAMPSLSSVERSRVALGVAELHLLRVSLDRIAAAFGAERSSAFSGDLVLYVDYYADLKTPQLNWRRMRDTGAGLAAPSWRRSGGPLVASADPVPRPGAAQPQPIIDVAAHPNHQTSPSAATTVVRSNTQWKLLLMVELWASAALFLHRAMRMCTTTTTTAHTPPPLGSSSGGGDGGANDEGEGHRDSATFLPPTYSNSGVYSDALLNASTLRSSFSDSSAPNLLHIAALALGFMEFGLACEGSLHVGPRGCGSSILDAWNQLKQLEARMKSTGHGRECSASSSANSVTHKSPPSHSTLVMSRELAAQTLVDTPMPAEICLKVLPQLPVALGRDDAINFSPLAFESEFDELPCSVTVDGEGSTWTLASTQAFDAAAVVTTNS